MDGRQTEERYPLLLLFLEDGQRAAREPKRMFFDKGRYQGITSGVTTVITQWPGQLATCLTTALFIGLAIVFLSTIMLLMSVTPPTQFLTMRCKNQIYHQDNMSSTVHLVHGPDSWSQYQLDSLDEIIKKYGASNIDLIIIQSNITTANSTNTTIPTQAIIKRVYSDIKHNTTKNIKKNPKNKRTSKTIPFPFPFNAFNVHVGTKRLLRMLLLDQANFNKQFDTTKKLALTTSAPKHKTINELLQKHTGIIVRNSTYEVTFLQSPLFHNWQQLNKATKLFAIRVLQIWNYGGITFDLPETSEPNSATGNSKLYTSSVDTGLKFFQNLPEGIVTVDDKGLHMETKTICHAFFGDILMKLRRAKNNTMPADVIQSTLRSFCRRGAVDIDYCNSIY